LKKCENCGHLNKNTDPFCEECGAPLLNQQLDWLPEQAKTKEDVNKKTSFPHFKKSFLFLGFILILLLGGLIYKWGEQRLSKEQQIADFVQNIEEQDAHAVSQQLTTNESAFQISPSSIRPLVEFLHGNKKELKKVEQGLKHKQKIHGLSLQQVGQTYLFFPRYRLVLTPVHVQVATNQEKVKLKVNQTELGTSNSSQYQQEFGPIVPGNYTFQAAIEDTTGDTILKNEVRFIDADTYSPMIDLNFKKITIPITSNLTDADIYVNNKKIGTYSEGTQMVGPLFWRENMTIQLKKAVNGEVIETAKETVKETDFSEQETENLTLHLNFPLVSSYDIRSALEAFYQELGAVSQEQQPASAKHFAATYLMNETANPAYEELWKLLANGTLAKKSAEYEVAINDFKLIGKDTYQVKYRLQASLKKLAGDHTLPEVEWIEGLTAQVVITKNNFSTTTPKFITIDERVLNWLIEQQ
jgi:uncharacterized membrane protein YvbJ